MKTLAAIMIAGALGAAARYGVDTVVSSRTGTTFPWGILVVNFTAAALLGLVVGMTAHWAGLGPSARLGITTGFIGSYSTFSTLMLDSVRMLERGQTLAGTVNLAASVGLGLAAVVLGLALGRALAPEGSPI
ncbi:MAG: CrcB family protein [Candidatus Dormibacteria bacterium]